MSVFSSSLIKAKLKASFLHGLITLVTGALGAYVVFFVWYPGELSDLVKGAEFYKLLMIVELCLGPLMSIVIFNPGKSRSELIRDYSLVGLIQLFALLYGLYATFISRPVFEVFVIDRLELLSAVELSQNDLDAAENPEYSHLPLWGKKQICVSLPVDPVEKSDLLRSALHGKDIELLPKYYRRCNKGELDKAALSKEQLIQLIKTKGAEREIDIQALGDFSWLPVKSRFGAWVKVYPRDKHNGAYYLNIDPFI